MKKLFLLAISLLLLVGCDQTNYQRGYNNGYANGYNQGKVDGYNLGHSEGQTAGYQKGYNDAMQSRNKDISITDANFKLFDEYSFKVFSVIFYIILILLLGYALIASAFINSKNDREIFGKIIFIIIGLGVSFLVFRIFNLSSLIFFKTDSVAVLVIVNLVIMLASYFLAWLVSSLLADDNKANDVFVIIFSVFLLFHILFLLTNIQTFLLNNPFFATCLISTAMGGLMYSGYRILFGKD